MSSDFNDMEDYECCKGSNCPRKNIFEGMSDEEIKNLFNKEEESTVNIGYISPKEVEAILKRSSNENNDDEPDLEEIKKKYPWLANIHQPDEMIEKFAEQRFLHRDLQKKHDEWVAEFNKGRDKARKTVCRYIDGNKKEEPSSLEGVSLLLRKMKPSEFVYSKEDIEQVKIPSDVNHGTCGGIKNDSSKPQLSLVPMQMVRDAALARMYGNNKYKDVPGYSSNNWCTLEKQRVIDAMLRHIFLYLEDMDGLDTESGLPHLCHVAANLSFLCEMQQPNWEEKKNKIIANDPILSKTNNTKEK